MQMENTHPTFLTHGLEHTTLRVGERGTFVGWCGASTFGWKFSSGHLGPCPLCDEAFVAGVPGKRTVSAQLKKLSAELQARYEIERERENRRNVLSQADIIALASCEGATVEIYQRCDDGRYHVQIVSQRMEMGRYNGSTLERVRYRMISEITAAYRTDEISATPEARALQFALAAAKKPQE